VPQLFGRDVVFWLEILDLATNAHVETTGVEQRDRVDARTASQQVAPRFDDAIATGVMAPRPVTTTRRGSGIRSLLSSGFVARPE
jgi:hypothetical protein